MNTLEPELWQPHGMGNLDFPVLADVSVVQRQVGKRLQYVLCFRHGETIRMYVVRPGKAFSEASEQVRKDLTNKPPRISLNSAFAVTQVARRIDEGETQKSNVPSA